MIYMNFMKTDLFTTGPLGDCCAGVGRDSAKGSKDSWNLLRSTKSGEKGFHGPAFCAASCQKQGEEKIVSKINAALPQTDFQASPYSAICNLLLLTISLNSLTTIYL